jgi:hypothetical protein
MVAAGVERVPGNGSTGPELIGTTMLDCGCAPSCFRRMRS